MQHLRDFFKSFTMTCAVGMTACIFLIPQHSYAGMIRDAEIEDYLRELSTPIYSAAGLNPSQVRMFIVQDDAINAFVAGGANMFLHTGLITETQTPEMLLGVIAHETGHISGGHLLRGQDAYRNAQVGSILSYLLGAAAIAGGGGQAGAAIIAAGSHASTRGILAYTRGNEQAADQAALSYFDANQLSSEGLMQMFERLRREEKRAIGADTDAYARTHPLSQSRVEHIRAHVENSAYNNNRLSADMHQKHQRIRAKLIGFLDKNGETFRTYPASDTSPAAHIARAIAYSKTAQDDKALQEIDAMLQQLPRDPYAHELRGHIFLEQGNVTDAITAYRTALELAPNSALIGSDYADALLASNDPLHHAEALKHLKISVQRDPTYHQSWRRLSIAEGKAGNIGNAELALAELAALNSDSELLNYHIERAETALGALSEHTLRLQDLKSYALQLTQREKEAGSDVF
jgi:predicted Zn-dependent protease